MNLIFHVSFIKFRFCHTLIVCHPFRHTLYWDPRPRLGWLQLYLLLSNYQSCQLTDWLRINHGPFMRFDVFKSPQLNYERHSRALRFILINEQTGVNHTDGMESVAFCRRQTGAGKEHDRRTIAFRRLRLFGWKS